MISRLSDQKGVDLLLYVADEILAMPLQLVVIGTGEARYEEGLRHVEERHPDKMRALIEFDEGLARKLYAASDLLLMPSVFEPCGLSQMLAMRYGALPVVRETGGLRDTVRPYNKFDGSGNGFSFSNINAHELLYTCQHAIALYYDDRAAWDKLAESALKEDFSWKESALKYLDLYREVLRENGHPEAAERVENPPLEPKEKKAAVSRPAKMTADNAPAAAKKKAGASSRSTGRSTSRSKNSGSKTKKPANPGE